MSLGSAIANVWDRFQGELFPALADEVGPLNAKHRRFVVALDLVPVERFLCDWHHGAGRPPEDRRAIARAFIAKAVWNLPTTRDLIDRLHCDPTLRRLCGWPRVSPRGPGGASREHGLARLCGVRQGKTARYSGFGVTGTRTPPGAGARRKPADDRKEARPRRVEDHRALCASCATLNPDRCLADHGKHRGRPVSQSRPAFGPFTALSRVPTLCPRSCCVQPVGLRQVT